MGTKRQPTSIYLRPSEVATVNQAKDRLDVAFTGISARCGTGPSLLSTEWRPSAISFVTAWRS